MWALLPVKDLRAGKSRLANSLPEQARQSLMTALLGDLLTNLQQAQGIEGILVVTRCPIAGTLATAHGAEVLDTQCDTGLNEAVSAGILGLTSRGIKTAMVMHADLPMATADDIELLVQGHLTQAADVSLVPDSKYNVTNVMLLTLPTRMTFAYGNQSYSAHLAATEQQTISVQTLTNEHIACDIDLWDDFEPLFSLNSNSRQRHHLAEWLQRYDDLFDWPQAINR